MKTVNPTQKPLKTNSPECENKPEDIKVIVQEAMGEYERAKVIDQQNVDIRKKNIIIFNAPESDHEATMNRKEDDISLFINIYNAISDVEISKEYITQARRLGMRSENGKIRPLLITLNSEEAKKNIFSRLNKLKDLAQFKNYSMSHDMTREERTKTKLLIEEANSKTINDTDSKNWIYKVHGPPWDQRIQGVRCRPQD